MKIVINNGVPEIRDLPGGNIVMFFAEIDPILGYCVVFGQEGKCIPRMQMHVELWSAAKVAFGKQDEEMRVVDVKHGHKYPESRRGGGMVEMAQEGTTETAVIFFRRPDHEKPSSIEAIFDGQEFCGGFHKIFTVV